MRIISGKLKGKPIYFLKNSNTRPIKDSVKENIFNILTHSKLINVEIHKSKILDLYSGVGSFGLECISRGAKKVTFLEKDKLAFNILNKNVIALSISKQAEIINNDIQNFLKSNKRKFNIFFFDPPFVDNGFIEYIYHVKKKKIFEKEHVVIIHREKNSNDHLENFLEIITKKKYGRSQIIFGVFN